MAAEHQAAVRERTIHKAKLVEIDLKPEDIWFADGEPMIDDVPADQWLDAQTQD